MADIHPQTASPLFQLPLEIREAIQRYALTENDLLTATQRAEFREAVFRINGGTKSLPAIMSTCKKMYLEMRLFAFTEMVVHFTAKDADMGLPRLGVLSHGNLRHERIRRISLVVDDPQGKGFISPNWYFFLHPLLVHCTEVDRLDFELGDNVFRKEVESKLFDSEERQRNGTATALDETVARHFAMPKWVADLARNPSLRRVCFEGDVPPVWLENLRKQSEGRIQVISDGVKYREKEAAVDSVADMEDPLRAVKEEEVKDPQIQFVYEAASRFDQE